MDGGNPHAIVAGLHLLGRLFPPPALESVTSLSLDQLKTKYRRVDLWVNSFIVVTFLLLAVAFYGLIEGVAEWSYQDVRNARYFLRPTEVEFGVWAFFLSLSSTNFVSMCLLRRVFGPENYAIYIAYGSNKSPFRFHLAKASCLLFCLFTPSLAGVVALRGDTWTAFTDQALIDSSFSSLGDRVEHRYADVRGVYEIRARHTRFQDKVAPYHLIIFTDGTEWQSDQGSGGYKLEQQREIMQFVSARSGRPMRHVDFIEEVPRR